MMCQILVARTAPTQWTEDSTNDEVIDVTLDDDVLDVGECQEVEEVVVVDLTL